MLFCTYVKKMCIFALPVRPYVTSLTFERWLPMTLALGSFNFDPWVPFPAVWLKSLVFSCLPTHLLQAKLLLFVSTEIKRHKLPNCLYRCFIGVKNKWLCAPGSWWASCFWGVRKKGFQAKEGRQRQGSSPWALEVIESVVLATR